MSEETTRKSYQYKRKRPVDYSMYRTDRPKRERRAREISHEEPAIWNTKDKEKLLEALHRHSPCAVESISHVVGTKTPKEVEDFIEKMVNTACFKNDKRAIEDDPEKGAAPLELWVSLVQELINRDKKEDHSKQCGKVLSVITRNEPMEEESGFHNLKWRNLYQFICDLLKDKAVPQTLSNMESLVMLDMMHSLGDTLHSSDIREQQILMDLKYQLYQQQSHQRTDGKYTAGLKAYNNDLSNVEYTMASKASRSSSTISSVSATPSTSRSTNPPQPIIAGHHQNPRSSTTETNLRPLVHLPSSSFQPKPCDSNSNALTSTLAVMPDQSLSLLKFLPSQLSTASSSTSSKVTVTASALGEIHSLSSSAAAITTDESQQSQSYPAQTSEETSESAVILTTAAATTTASSEETGGSNNSGGDNQTASSSIVINRSDSDRTVGQPAFQTQSTFTMSKMFSLNPLTIPHHLLSLQLQQPNKDGLEIPVVLDVSSNV